MAFHVTTRVPLHPFCLVLLLSLLIGTAVARRIRHVDSDFHEPEPPPTFTEDEPSPKGAVTPQQPDVDREIPVYDVGIRRGIGDGPPAYDVGVPALARPPRPVDEEPTSMAEDSQPPDDDDDVPVADADAAPSMYKDLPPSPDDSDTGTGPEASSKYEELPHGDEGERDTEPATAHDERPVHDGDELESGGPEPSSKYKEPYGDEEGRDSEPATVFEERPAPDEDALESHGPEPSSKYKEHPDGDEAGRDSEPAAVFDEGPAHDEDVLESYGPESSSKYKEQPDGDEAGRDSEPATVFDEGPSHDEDVLESYGPESSSKYKEQPDGDEAGRDSEPATVFDEGPARDEDVVESHGPEPPTMHEEETGAAGSEEHPAVLGGTEKLRVPMECSWFTESMRKCKRRLSGERFQYMLKKLQNSTYRKDLFDCLTEKSGYVPDNMYCTDAKSVQVVTSCVKDNVKKQAVSGAEEIQALLDETKKCLNEIHKEKISRLKRPETRRRRNT